MQSNKQCKWQDNTEGKEAGRKSVRSNKGTQVREGYLYTQGDERGGENQNMGTPDTSNLKIQDYYK